MSVLLLPRRFKRQPAGVAPFSAEIRAQITPVDYGALCAFNLRYALIGKYSQQGTLSRTPKSNGIHQRGNSNVTAVAAGGAEQLGRPLLGFVNFSLSGSLPADKRLISFKSGASPNACFLNFKTTGLVELYWNSTLSCASTIAVDDGRPHTIAIAGAINDQRLYIDGVLDGAGTVAADAGWIGGDGVGRGLSIDYQFAYSTPFLSVSTGGYFHNWNPGLAKSLSANIWQVYQASARRLWAVTSGPTHNPAGASSTQSHTTSTAAITQAHVLAGAASSQASTSSTGAITLGAVNDLIGAASLQGNTIGSGAITLTQVLTAATLAQNGTSAAVAITQVHVLAAAAVVQGNLGGAGAISAIGEFVGMPSTQGNLSGIGRITRTQALTGAGSIQANLSSAGAISDGIVVEMALMTGITGTIRIKKPGIPAGTPEWLRTMLEIIVGRRGNKIEIPNFQTLTFSATPTKTECEALYSYTNDVRTAVENIITRLDS